MKKYKISIISLLVLISVVLSCLPIKAQDESVEPAEVNAYISGKIPSVKITKWTAINITLEDAFGIDWDFLKDNLFPFGEGFNILYMNIIWSLNPLFPQPVKRFLGYTKLRLEPEVIEGNPDGWYFRITPNFISETNTGRVWDIKLEARVDDSKIDYSIIVGIKCTRIDTLGGEIGTSYIYVPVKASPTNFVKMRPSQTEKKTTPRSIVYFDIDITNEGYYKDVFQFKLEEENGLLALLNEQAITMSPGETKTVTLGVLTPEKFWDPGTPNKIDISVYSAGDPEPTLVGSLVVYTEGFFISPLLLLIIVPIIIILIFLYLIFLFSKEKKYKNMLAKPKKPWTIPSEQKYLEELKGKNKEDYEKERQMMDDEYQSAILWYKSYRNYIIRQQNNKDFLSKYVKYFKKLVKRSKKQGMSEKKEKINEDKVIKNKKLNILSISKPKKISNQKKKKNNDKIINIINSTKKKKPKKQVKKKRVKKPNKLDIIKPRKETKKVDKQSEKEKLIAQIKKDQEKQKSKI